MSIENKLLSDIQLIDFYLHGVDRNISYQGDYGLKSYKTDYKEGGTTVRHSLHYHTSLDALRPVIVKLNKRFNEFEYMDDPLDNGMFYMLIDLMNTYIRAYFYVIDDFAVVFDSVVECIKYLNEKKK